MHGIVLGVAMLICSAGVAPVRDAADVTLLPVRTTLILPAAPSPDRLPSIWKARSAPVRRSSGSSKRFSPTERIIAIAAGVSVGWIVGLGVGARITDSSNPSDDTSALKGAIIGAPIGATLGGILGWRLTR